MKRKKREPGSKWKKLVAIRGARLRCEVKSILWAIALRENEDSGWTTTSRETIGSDVGLGLRTVAKYLPQMERQGMVKFERRYNNSSRRQVNVGRLSTKRRDLLPLSESATRARATRASRKCNPRIEKVRRWHPKTTSETTSKTTWERRVPAQKPSPLLFQGLHLGVTGRQDKLLAEAFPWVDRSKEYRKADSWLDANPERRPKKTGRFLHNWFSRILSPGEKGGPSRVPADGEPRRPEENRQWYCQYCGEKVKAGVYNCAACDQKIQRKAEEAEAARV